MSGNNADAPDVKIIPPLVYLAGILIGLLASIWMPAKVVPYSLAWTVGGILVASSRAVRSNCGACILAESRSRCAPQPNRADEPESNPSTGFFQELGKAHGVGFDFDDLLDDSSDV